MRPAANTAAVNYALEMIRQAKHPLLLVGAGANRKRIVEALEGFGTKNQIPFFNTQKELVG